MQFASHRAIDAPFAWNGRDLQRGTEWLRPFSAAELAEIDAELQSVRRREIALFDIGRDDFPLPAIHRTLSQRWRDVTEFRAARTGVHAQNVQHA